MPNVAAFVGYEMPHFDQDFFESMTPKLLGVGDSMDLMPFVSTRWFANNHPGLAAVQRIKQGERVVAVLQTDRPLFCVGSPMHRMPWVSVVSQSTLPTYVIVAWDDDGMTYGVRALISGQEEAENNICRFLIGGGQIDQVLSQRSDGTLAAMARGVFKSHRPWYRMAFGLPWDGRIMDAMDIVMGERRTA